MDYFNPTKAFHSFGIAEKTNPLSNNQN